VSEKSKSMRVVKPEELNARKLAKAAHDKAYSRAYHSRNRERIRIRQREYYWKNRKRILAGIRKWHAENPGKNFAYKTQCLVRKGSRPQPTRPEPTNCECCGRVEDGRFLCLDHDHVTGKFRGWLCGRCNRAIGQLGDSLVSVRLAVAYLERAS
jgi:Recombination endonuclease VII